MTRKRAAVEEAERFGAKLGVPIPLAVKTRRPEGLGGLLQRVDEMVTASTLDGPELNAADFLIAPTVKLAMTMQDLRPLIESRPAGAPVHRVQPPIAGDFPPILPAAWLEPLRQTAAA